MRDIQLIGILLWRNFAVILLCLSLGLGMGAWKVYHAQTLYQASATLMLNDKESGASKFMKSFESFSVTGKLMTEIEVLRSRYLIGKAVDKLNFNIPVQKKVRGEWRELYLRSPFQIDLHITDPAYQDTPFDITYAENGAFLLEVTKGAENIQLNGKLDETVEHPGFHMCISANTSYLDEHPQALSAGMYRVESINRDRLIDHFSGDALTLKLVDKEVSIVKVYFRHTVPLKAQHFVNTLIECYLNDFITNKTEAANKALGFINTELNAVSGDLRSSEQKIAAFKQAEGITELSLEADDRLKKLRERDLQRTKLAMELAELERLSQALVASHETQSVAGEIGVLSNVSCQRALERLQSLEVKKTEQLLIYTSKHPEVRLLQKQIETARKALLETLSSTLASHMAKMRKLDFSIIEIEKKLHAYPVAEQKLLAYQRSYSSKQKTYDFLLNKRIEAGIGVASQINFHKVLERAGLPRRPIGMGKKVVLAIGLMIGIGLGLMVVLALYYARGPVLLSSEAEESLEAPILGLAPTSPKLTAYTDLATQLTVTQKSSVQALVTWGSKTKQTAIAEKLAAGLSVIGKRVLLMHAGSLPYGANLAQVMAGTEAPLAQAAGYDIVTLGATESERLALIHSASFPTWLHSQSSLYDNILIDTPPLSLTKQALPLLKLAQNAITIAKKGTSRKVHLQSLRKELAAVGTHNTIIWTA